jgi:hypothetical protein
MYAVFDYSVRQLVVSFHAVEISASLFQKKDDQGIAVCLQGSTGRHFQIFWNRMPCQEVNSYW